jgi:hypothetical protein
VVGGDEFGGVEVLVESHGLKDVYIASFDFSPEYVFDDEESVWFDVGMGVFDDIDLVGELVGGVIDEDIELVVFEGLGDGVGVFDVDLAVMGVGKVVGQGLGDVSLIVVEAVEGGVGEVLSPEFHGGVAEDAEFGDVDWLVSEGAEEQVIDGGVCVSVVEGEIVVGGFVGGEWGGEFAEWATGVCGVDGDGFYLHSSSMGRSWE